MPGDVTETPHLPWAADAPGNFVVAWDSDGSAGRDIFQNSAHAQLFGVPTTSTTSTNSTTLPSAACPPASDPGCIDVTTPGTRPILRDDMPGSESLVLRTGRGPA